MLHIIRQVKPDGVDAFLFRDLRLEALSKAPEAFCASLFDEAAKDMEWWEERTRKSAIFGAFNKAAMGGMVGLSQSDNDAGKRILWGMYVSPWARGQGIGRDLLWAALNHARYHGAQRVGLTVLVREGDDAPLNLYRSMGFQDTHIKGDQRHMIKALNPP